jgi:hypothetical protein
MTAEASMSTSAATMQLTLQHTKILCMYTGLVSNQ